MKLIRTSHGFLFPLLLLLTLFTVIPVGAWAVDPEAPVQSAIAYLDENGQPRTAESVTEITSSMTALSAGWYAVTDNTEISDRIICDGDVYLILCDGATLTALEGIAVNEDDCLTV